MAAFSNIARQAVLPLGAYKLESLMRDAERSDQRVLLCDFDSDRFRAARVEAPDIETAVARTIANAFGLDEAQVRSLEALGRSLLGLKPTESDQPGFVVILQNLPNDERFGSAERDALLDVFRDAADHFFDRDTAFRMFYSVAPRT